MRNLQGKLAEVLEKLAKVTTDSNTNGDKKRKRKKYYCWSCGSNSNHPGCTCTRKKDGYQDKATEEDKIGGSTNRFN